ncbi:hypothetical protein V2J09_009732 [Rumex salicifolius]
MEESDIWWYATGISYQKREDVVHRAVLRRTSHPDWLPFQLCSFYRVPPKSQSHGFAHVMTNLANSVGSSTDPAIDLLWTTSFKLFD